MNEIIVAGIGPGHPDYLSLIHISMCIRDRHGIAR